jgi:ABC-type branched-subunit amino acid transport system substrate-binding protein
MKHTWLRIAIVVVAGTLTVASCSDDDSSETGSSGGTTEQTSGSEPAGEPIVLGVIGDGQGATPPSTNLETAVAGADAAAQRINDEGGINGRPIEIVQCDTKADLNSAADCARDLLDQGVIALVGAASQVGSGFLPIVEDAGIPSVGHFPVTEAELVAQLTYPLVSASPGLLIGQGVLAGELEMEHPSLVRLNQDALAQAVELIDMGLAVDGLSIVNEVQVPPQAPDMSSYVAAATRDGADGVLALMLPQDLVNFVTAMKQAGSDVPVIASSNTVLEAIQQGFGDDIEGVYAVGWMVPPTVSDNEGAAQFVTDMEAYDPDASRQDVSANAWMSVDLVATVAADLDTIDPSSLTSALNGVTDFDGEGLIPPLSFAAPQQLIPGLRLFNTSVLFTQVQDGDFDPVTGEFVDVFAEAAAAAGGG